MKKISKSTLNDRIVSTVENDGAYEVAISFANSSEWIIWGKYDKETAIKKHKELEVLTIKQIAFRIKYFN